MAKLLRLRRGTDTQHTTFTGAEGEVTVNTTNDSLHVHDGATAGGREVARADLSNVSGTTEGSIDVTGELQCDSLDVDGAADISGNVTLHGNLDLQDNDKILLGTGDDLEIYHDGTNTFLDNSTGSFVIRNLSDDKDVGIQSDDGSGGLAYYVFCDGSTGSANLYHYGSNKLTTLSTGINVTGTVTCDGVTSEGQVVAQGNAEYQIRVKDGNNTGTAAETGIQFVDSANTQQAQIGCISSGNADLYVGTTTSTNITFQTNNQNRVQINGSGHLVPAADETYDLGAASQQWRDGYFDGTVFCDGLSCAGAATIEAASGELKLKDTDGTGGSTSSVVVGVDSNNSSVWYVGHASSGDNALYVSNQVTGDINFRTGAGTKAVLQSDGHFRPQANNTYDLGTSSLRWRNIYTNDMNLSNEGGANDVDGTWGSWTIQEGEDDLFLLNRRNGKKYKFNLSEVN